MPAGLRSLTSRPHHLGPALFVVRGPSATMTLGGGQVLQPVRRKSAAAPRNAGADRNAVDRRLRAAGPHRRLVAATRFHPGGTLSAAPTLPPDQALEVMQKLRADHSCRVTLGHNRQVVLHRTSSRELDERILPSWGSCTTENPLMTSHDRQKVQAQLGYVGDDALVHAAVEPPAQGQRWSATAPRPRTDFKPKLSANLRKLKERSWPRIGRPASSRPSPRPFANQAAATRPASRTCSTSVSPRASWCPSVADVFLHASVEGRHAPPRRRSGCRAPARPSPRSAICSAPRAKYAGPFCEYLDRVAVTRRDGDLRLSRGGPGNRPVG